MFRLQNFTALQEHVHATAEGVLRSFQKSISSQDIALLHLLSEVRINWKKE